MPRAKAVSKPRGRMTSFSCFMQICREEHKKKFPDEGVPFGDFTRICAERWKIMLDKEKRRFQEMAIMDKMRYDREMKEYGPGPAKVEKSRGKKRKRTKDPNAPKRNLSGFFLFCGDQRPIVKGMNPEYGVGEIAKVLGRLWKEAEPEVKQKYVAMAEKDKERFEREMTAYKAGLASPSAQNDDDDDEESD